jgi:hypothetical protein
MSAATELNRQTEQEIMDYLLTLARTGDDPQPFVDLDTGDRYPPRQVYASLHMGGRP